MGLGALLIPGGHDSLLMIGFPMAAWQAVLAYILFVATLGALIIKFGSTSKLLVMTVAHAAHRTGRQNLPSLHHLSVH